jgi:hypothetical protein
VNDNDIDLLMKPKERILKFKSYKEEAEFWDTHDVTDYWDDFAPVQMSTNGELVDGLFVRLDAETLSAIRKAASACDVSPSALVRTWIRERLSEVRSRASVSD